MIFTNKKKPQKSYELKLKKISILDSYSNIFEKIVIELCLRNSEFFLE